MVGSGIKTMLVTLATLAAGGLAIRSASGHGEVIRLAADAVAAGDSLGVTGEGFGENAEVALVLEGAAGTTVLGTVRGDLDGRFETSVLIPADVRPGAYRVAATAGEDRATADLVVTAGSTAETVGEHGLHAREEATAEEMDLDRRRPPVETGVAWAAVLLLLALGGYLVRRPGREE